MNMAKYFWHKEIKVLALHYTLTYPQPRSSAINGYFRINWRAACWQRLVPGFGPYLTTRRVTSVRTISLRASLSRTRAAMQLSVSLQWSGIVIGWLEDLAENESDQCSSTSQEAECGEKGDSRDNGDRVEQSPLLRVFEVLAVGASNSDSFGCSCIKWSRV